MIPFFLKLTYPIDKSFLCVSKFSLILLGFWPHQKVTFKLFIWALINMMILCYATFGELAFGIIHIKQLLLALDAFCPGSTRFVTIIKLTIFIIKRNEMATIIDDLWNNIHKVANSPEKIRIVQVNSTTANTLIFIVLLFSNLTNVSFNTRPLLGNWIQHINGQNITLELPFKIPSPDFLTQLPAYPVIFVILFWSGIVTIYTMAGVDGVFLGFCSNISSLFEILQKDIQEIFADITKCDKMASEVDNDICYEKLVKIIKRHYMLIDLTNKFRSLFTPMIMSHFLVAAIIICISIIDVLMNTGFGILLFTFYTCAVLVQLFVYCLGGTRVIESSSNVGDIIYQVEWYKCNTKVRKVILLIILRSQRPSSIAVPFFAPSLEAFGVVLSSTMSYIALLKTFL